MAEGNKDDRFCKRIDFSSGNTSTSWKTFKMQFEIYKVAKKYADMTTEREKISNMLLQMGNESVPIFNQFTFNDDDDATRKTLENVIKLFDNYFEPVKNVIYERAKFNMLRQGEKSIHQYIVALQNQADQCDYGTVKDELIRDRIVVGVRDKRLHEYLIDVEDMDLTKCIKKAKQWVSNHTQSSNYDFEDDNVDYVNAKNRSDTRKRVEVPSTSYPCKFCGKNFHRGKNCPAKFSVCRVCNEKGHWAKSAVCKNKAIGELASATNDMSVEDTDGLFLGDSL